MKHAADVEHDGARHAGGKVGVVQSVADRARIVALRIVDRRVELGDVVDDAAAAAGDVGRGAVGAGEGGNRLPRALSASDMAHAAYRTDSRFL